MKYLILLLLFVFIACDDKKEVKPTSNNVNDTVVEVSKNTSEISSNQDLIKIVDYKGLTPLLAKRNDTTYVVNFWATWCKPCVKELPAFEKLNADYSNEKVKVVLVSLDFPDKLEKQVVPYVKKHLKSEVVLLDDADANFWIPAIDKTWSGAIPATIIYNKNKRTFYERSFTFEELEKEVVGVL